MEYECYFVDGNDDLELGNAAITVLVDYRVDQGCPAGLEDPGYPPHIQVEYVSLRQIENERGTINYDALTPEKKQHIEDWVMTMIRVEGVAQIEDHESYLLDDEGAYSDEG